MDGRARSLGTRPDHRRRADRRRHPERAAAVPARRARRSCCAARRRTSGPTATRRCAARPGCSARWPAPTCPTPALIAAEPDLDVIGAAFYLMEPVDGFNATLGLPEPHALRRRPCSTRWACRWPTRSRALGPRRRRRRRPRRPRQARRLARAAGAALAQAARRPTASCAGYPGPSIPGVDDVAAWLDDHRPDDIRMGLIHGDFHFANVLIAPDRAARWRRSSTGS